jgi:site-specific recombinase XerC
LTVQEGDALIAAAKNPFEKVVPEFLYSTGLRISEAVGLRLEKINFAQHVLLVKKGRRGKGRYVPYGLPCGEGHKRVSRVAPIQKVPTRSACTSQWNCHLSKEFVDEVQCLECTLSREKGFLDL